MSITGIFKWMWSVVQKLISAGVTVGVTAGTYSVTVMVSDVLSIQIPEPTVDALVKGIVSLLAGYGIWIKTVKTLKGEETEETTAGLTYIEKKKSGFELF